MARAKDYNRLLKLRLRMLYGVKNSKFVFNTLY